MRRELDLGERYPAETVFGFLAARAIPGVEAVDGLVYRRTWIDGSGRGCIVGVDASDRIAFVDSGSADPDDAVRLVRRMLDLDAPAVEIDAVLSGSVPLRPLVERRPGMRVPGGFDGYEIAVRAILGQQVTVKGASTIAGRIASAHGAPLDRPEGALTHVFPAPSVLARADLSNVGMPAGRGRAINAVATAVADGLALDDRCADTGRALLALPGVGPWTASYVAMRALRDPDAFPAGDLGLRRALRALGSDRPVEATADEWRPWRAYAAMHLWASLGDT